MQAMKRIFFQMRGWLGPRRLRLDISEEDILADLSYGRDDEEVTGPETDSLPDADDRILMN
jgi:hypothetical protein